MFHCWRSSLRSSLTAASAAGLFPLWNGDSNGALNLAIDRRNQGNVRSAITWLKKAIAMNNGDAYIALAKIYRTREGGRQAAITLLRRSLRLSKTDISAAAKDEAKSQLRAMGETSLTA